LKAVGTKLAALRLASADPRTGSGWAGSASVLSKAGIAVGRSDALETAALTASRRASMAPCPPPVSEARKRGAAFAAGFALSSFSTCLR
jgi:hypothetical protein